MVAQDKVTCWYCKGNKQFYDNQKKRWVNCDACYGAGWVYQPSKR